MLLERLPRSSNVSGARDGVKVRPRNALFLTTTSEGLLQAAALLQLWSGGYVEPITAPPAPRHIAAQQILALCLQEGRVGSNTWRQWWGDLGVFDDSAEEISDWLLESGHLEADGGMWFIGPEAEHRFGRRNFMDLLSVFTANPEFTVLQGRQELGSVDPVVLTRKVDGPRVIVLAARSWEVTYIDWKRRRCFVEPSDIPARMKWMGDASPLSYELAQAHRRVLLGADPDVVLSKRAVSGLAELREDHGLEVSERGLGPARRGQRRVVVDLGGCPRQRHPARCPTRGGGSQPEDRKLPTPSAGSRCNRCAAHGSRLRRPGRRHPSCIAGSTARPQVR